MEGEDMTYQPTMVPERVVRGVAALVVLLAATGLATGHPVFLWLLALDFGIRAFTGARFSPLSATARWASRLAHGLPRMVPAAPKRFAARLGFAMFAAAAVLATFTPLSAVAWAIALAVMVLAMLEAAAGICVGCILYKWMARAGWVGHDDCPNCVIGH